MVKEETRQLLNNLPDDLTWEDLMESIYLKLKLEKAQADLDAGRGISHETVKAKFNKWLSH